MKKPTYLKKLIIPRKRSYKIQILGENLHDYLFLNYSNKKK